VASFIDSFVVISFSRVCFLGSAFFFWGFFGSKTVDPIWQAVGSPKSRSLAEGSVGVSSAATPHHVLDSVWTQDLLWSQRPRTGYTSEPSPLNLLRTSFVVILGRSSFSYRCEFDLGSAFWASQQLVYCSAHGPNLHVRIISTTSWEIYT